MKATVSRFLIATSFFLVAPLVSCGESDGGADPTSAAGSGGENAGDGGTSGSQGGSSNTTGGKGGSASSSGGSGNAGTAGSGGGSAGTTGSGGGNAGTTGSGGGSAGTTGAGGSGGIPGSPADTAACTEDCEALPATACATDPFDLDMCVADCLQTLQTERADAAAIGCLEQYETLHVCRLDDPACTHPNPNECVAENDAYIQCLEDAIP